MKYLKKFNESMEIDKICKDLNINNYDIDNKGLVNVDGSVILIQKKLKKLPIKFGVVTGNFDCSMNSLMNLYGSPIEVGGEFSCWKNNLINLRFSPKICESFNCMYNNLISLEGCTESLSGSFCCIYNKLNSLWGCPKRVDMFFNCYNNNLTNLDYCPKSNIEGNFNCSHNKINTLVGGPEYVNGIFDCQSNELTSLYGMPKCEHIVCSSNPLPEEMINTQGSAIFRAEIFQKIFQKQEDYQIWNPDGSFNKGRFNQLMIEIEDEDN